MSEAKFSIGQIVHHELFNYRGVVIDVDFKFLGSEEWYQQVARSRPPKNQPWYHVLVDQAIHQTYVAERNIKASEVMEAIQNPLLNHFFTGIKEGQYQLKIRQN